MPQVREKHFQEYLNIKLNTESATRYFGLSRVGKYFIE